MVSKQAERERRLDITDRRNNVSDFEIQDDFLSKQEYQELTTLHIEYGKVHWIGLHAKPLNILHTLVQSIRSKQDIDVLGATAWYNIRPPMPGAHNDIDSYCTFKGKKNIPDILPNGLIKGEIYSWRQVKKSNLKSIVWYHFP